MMSTVLAPACSAQAVISNTTNITGQSYILNPTGTGSGPHAYKIATLPINNVGDDDHLHLVANLNYGWAAAANGSVDVLFGNRGGFTYTYLSRGIATSPTARLVAYANADTSVDIYLMFTNVYATASYTVLETTEETVYPNPADLGAATPTGTLVFDSSSASYPPATFSGFNGNFGIGTATPTQKLSVNGSANTAGPGYGFVLRTPPASQTNTLVSPQLLFEAVVSGNGSASLPWGTNLMAIPWTWGQDPITYHAGTHDFRVIAGNTAEKDVMQINSGGIVFPAGNGASVIFQDGSVQSVAWNGVLGGGDYAESVDVIGDRAQYEPGDVLVIDPSSKGKFLKSTEAYSTAVMGIYSTRPGVVGRRQKTDKSHMKDEVPMAMVGVVPTKVSAESGAIKPGDLLVTSSKPGYAMKGTDRTLLTGAIIGKALEPLDTGTGVIEVAVSIQ